MKFHNRHQKMRELGRHISKGEWERMNTVYNVFHVKTVRRLIGHDAAGNPKYLIEKKYTRALHPECAKAHRKCGMQERFAPEGTKRSRYADKFSKGITK